MLYIIFLFNANSSRDFFYVEVVHLSYYNIIAPRAERCAVIINLYLTTIDVADQLI